MAKVDLKLRVTPTNVTQGPFASMATIGMTFVGNTATPNEPVEFSPARQRIQLTIMGDETTTCDYEVFDGEDSLKKGTAKITDGDTEIEVIRFYFKKRK